MSIRRAVPLFLFTCLAAACADPALDPAVGSDDAASSGEDAADTTSVSDTGVVAGEGLPCEIDEILARSCRSCHGATPSAPMPLVRYDDLVATSSDPARTYAELALDRMQSSTAPMPPGAPGTVPVDDLAVWAEWLLAGTPPGDCGAEPGTTDGPPTEPPELMCSSDRWWDSDDDDGSPRMFPGRACISCHDDERADDPDDDDIPDLVVGGTIYPSLFEPDDCKGADLDDVIIELLAANGETVQLVPNDSGNFLVHRRDAPTLQPPFSVTVRRGDATRQMGMQAPHGNCNACHTETGSNGAPGRILLP